MSYKIGLNDAYKKHTLDQDKILAPEDTVKRFRDKIKKMDINILEEVRRIDNGRLDIPVFFSVCGHDAKTVTGTTKQMGKGATIQQAEASAVMELAERFSFFSFCKKPENFFTDTYANVKDKAIPFEMIAKSVHDESGDLDISKKIFETLPLQWTKAYNLTQNREVLVPFNWFFMINEFNGPSAGNCREEAISQGICEIVERHVSSIVSHQKLNVDAINPDSATDSMVVEMLKKYKNNGIRLYISDFSLGMGIPSVGILGYDPSSFPAMSELVWTAGTTPDPEKALSRALTEVAQLAGDFNTGSNYVASGLPKFTKLSEADFIINPEREINISDLPDISNNNIRIEVENCVSALEQKGMDVILIDTMHSQLEIPAFYTIIPGAHFRERALGTSVGMFSAKMISENNNPLESIMKLEEIDEQLPGKYYTKFYLGSNHLELNDPETAWNYLRQSLDLNPNEQDIPSIYSYMGVCLKDMGKYDEALEVLKKGEQFDNERTDIYNLMGFCHFMKKDHEKAIECFGKVIELDPSSGIDYANIASNYRDMGKKDEAIQFYKTALEIDPSIDFARDNLEKLRGQ
ncbi:MAG: tetratricopeptide repeat protein [Desulfobacterales bacterium]|jgi:ribosomal protein S12 methylthiotransferase accessory factor|nr:tetratricopeptide repeat protein [Desulfobacteraceae bacterium]MBT4365454.1 tetratricopeptide repeat protein [Desulfobacteraceae bacterium]MBT7085621.1 tetratricopeptide repeat protein [Desulfobacterales bacterium]MBT7696479.1 tetratricopeptide repeat protein [Desulfobacterales bacterium]